ncbi:hypothetical protein [Brevibacillus sp. H7]|uniref:hypothetical protein n=1 Tax=Brevibacillus sp. H7 TaxID=3349138 RepID=UPI00380A8D68
MKKVKVTDPRSPYFGQELEGYCWYYDYLHTGDSPDLYIVKTPEGKKQLLSTQIDEKHYEAQELAEEIERLGANVGDTVMILRTGSGSSVAGFSTKVPHVISHISSSGTVTFDNGAATMFRPDVERVI